MMTKDKELILDDYIIKLGYNQLLEDIHMTIAQLQKKDLDEYIITEIEICKESLFYVKRHKIDEVIN
jgi:hypothetical protein